MLQSNNPNTPILEKMLSFAKEGRWCQSLYCNHGKMCLLGMWYAATNNFEHKRHFMLGSKEHQKGHDFIQPYLTKYDAVVLGNPYPHEVPFSSFWNDAPERKLEDIIDFLSFAYKESLMENANDYSDDSSMPSRELADATSGTT